MTFTAKLLGATATTALIASGAMAGGLDRSGQPTTVIFEQGRYLEFSAGQIYANVDGIDPSGARTGEGPEDYLNYSAAYKADINDTLSYAVILDQPYGSDTDYDTPGSLYNGLSSDLNALALTALMRYELSGGFSVYGGLKAQQVDATAAIPAGAFAASLARGLVENGAGPIPAGAFGGGDVPTATGIILASGFQGYSVDASRDTSFGYVAGVAYERPEIALRVALTYHSAIEHENSTVESGTAFIPTGANSGNSVAFTNARSTTNTEFPDAINLDFQTGIAADTLIFGRIRWTDYSEFALAPAQYGAITGGQALSSYEDDAWSYQIGVGRRLNDNFSMAFSVSYEATGPSGDSTALSPANGRIGYTLGGTYTRENMKITAGISYTDLGDAVSPQLGSFRDNDALALGIKVGFQL